MTVDEIAAWLVEHGWTVAILDSTHVQAHRDDRAWQHTYIWQPTLLGGHWRIERRRRKAATR